MERSVFHWVCVCALGAGPLVGCQDVSEFQTYRFNVSESLPDSTAFSEGVEICEADTENCVTTDPFGEAELDVRSNKEVTFTLEKEGFGPFLFGDVSDGTFGIGGGTVFFRMFPNDQLAAITAQLQTPYPWEGGMVGLGVSGVVAGVMFTPVGSTIEMVGEVFYFDEPSRQYSLDLEATTAVIGQRSLPFGEGGFTEVTPGEQQFEFGGTVDDCTGPG